MTLERRPSAEQLREQLTAKRTLARMAQFADLGSRWETEACPLLRQGFAERYRRLIGVHPSLREEFHAALLRIVDGGRMPVQDVIDVLGSAMH